MGISANTWSATQAWMEGNQIGTTHLQRGRRSRDGVLLQSALGRWLWSLHSSMACGMWRPPRWNGTSGRRSCGLAASGDWAGKCGGAAATRRRQRRGGVGVAMGGCGALPPPLLAHAPAGPRRAHGARPHAGLRRARLLPLSAHAFSARRLHVVRAARRMPHSTTLPHSATTAMRR